jgi:hypothetical protein
VHVIPLHQSAIVHYGLEVTAVIMATPGASDLGQYFDFGEAAIPDEHHAQNTAAVQSGEG